MLRLAILSKEDNISETNTSAIDNYEGGAPRKMIVST